MGDQESFSEIYEEFIDSLFAYGCKITRDRELVKDCIQDIFIDLQRLQPNLHNPEYIEFYLFKSLKNAIIHKTHQDKRFYDLEIGERDSFNFQFSIEQDVFDLEFEHLRKEKLKKILLTIDNQRRELLYLKFNTGLSYAEIGQMLNMNPDTVKKQVYRTLDYLRVKFGHQLLELMIFFAR